MNIQPGQHGFEPANSSFWEGMQVTFAESGAITLTDTSGNLIADLAVVFDQPWQLREVSFQLDESEASYQIGDVEAKVYFVVDHTISLRVVFANRSGKDRKVPGCALQIISPYPPVATLAGAFAVIDLGNCPSGSGLQLSQKLGAAQPSCATSWAADDDLCTRVASKQASQIWLTEPSFLLTGDGRSANRKISWTLDTVDPSQMWRSTPNWWPQSCLIDLGDEISLDLPDAVVSSSSANVAETDEKYICTTQKGVHQIEVNCNLGKYLIDLYWPPSIDSLLGQIAKQILKNPWCANAADALLVLRANQKMLTPNSEANSYLQNASEMLIAKSSNENQPRAAVVGSAPKPTEDHSGENIFWATVQAEIYAQTGDKTLLSQADTLCVSAGGDLGKVKCGVSLLNIAASLGNHIDDLASYGWLNRYLNSSDFDSSCHVGAGLAWLLDRAQRYLFSPMTEQNPENIRSVFSQIARLLAGSDMSGSAEALNVGLVGLAKLVASAETAAELLVSTRQSYFGALAAQLASGAQNTERKLLAKLTDIFDQHGQCCTSGLAGSHSCLIEAKCALAWLVL